MEAKLECLDEEQSEAEEAGAEEGQLLVSSFLEKVIFVQMTPLMLFFLITKVKCALVLFSPAVSGRRGGRFSTQAMG